jgi:hypothetical protein
MKRAFLLVLGLMLVPLATSAHATSGPGCLRVVNVASWDVLNIRRQPNANSRIVGEIDPNDYGIIALNGPCRPKSTAWRNRWCPITYYDDQTQVRGWVRARFVRDRECP